MNIQNLSGAIIILAAIVSVSVGIGSLVMIYHFAAKFW